MTDTTQPSGWTTETVHAPGRKRRVGGKHFKIGHKSQIRGVRLPDSDEWCVLVANELGDVRAYRDVPSNDVTEVLLRVLTCPHCCSQGSIPWLVRNLQPKDHV
jgi:hypothetical protein